MLQQQFPNIKNKKKLLKNIRQKYPNKPRFFELVKKDDEPKQIVDLPSSYCFDDLESHSTNLESSSSKEEKII